MCGNIFAHARGDGVELSHFQAAMWQLLPGLSVRGGKGGDKGDYIGLPNCGVDHQVNTVRMTAISNRRVGGLCVHLDQRVENLLLTGGRG